MSGGPVMVDSRFWPIRISICIRVWFFKGVTFSKMLHVDDGSTLIQFGVEK